MKVLEAFNYEDELAGYNLKCPGCKNWHTIYTRKIKNRPAWRFDNNLEKPTFTPSLLLTYHDKRRCHSFIRNGQWEFLNDCTHELAGKTVPMVELNNV